jgi:hypothetical protein
LGTLFDYVRTDECLRASGAVVDRLHESTRQVQATIAGSRRILDEAQASLVNAARVEVRVASVRATPASRSTGQGDTDNDGANRAIPE